MGIGIPAARHPDYAALDAALKSLAAARAQREADIDADIRLAMAEARERSQYLTQDDINEAKLAHPIIEMPLDVARALCAAYGTALYREDFASPLSVRYDAVGKRAWARERQRLGI